MKSKTSHIPHEEWTRYITQFSHCRSIRGAIAAHLKVSEVSVSRALRVHGILIDAYRSTPAPSPRLLPPPPKEVLGSLYSQPGQTISTLARHFHTSNPTVRKWLIGYNIPRKSHKQASQEANYRDCNRKNLPPKEELQELYATKSIEQIQRHYHVGQNTFYQWAEILTLPLMSHKEACAKRVYTFHKRSIGESQLEDLCRSLAPTDTWVTNDRTLIAPQELDLLNHTRKLAIEYCGVYWHTESFGKKDRQYHAAKMHACRDRGYELLTIFDSDPEEAVKALIMSKLSAVPRKIGARNCHVQEISPLVANTFHTTHHRAGACSGGRVHIGIFQGEELLQVLSLGHSRFSTRYQWEILRATNQPGILVQGGLSKLWSYFRRTYLPASAVSYADLRTGSGAGYLNLGFVLSHYSQPNYWYYKAGDATLSSRVKFQKHKLASQLPLFDPLRTEWENMQEHGYDRIWDCGNAVYVWTP